MKGPYVIGTDIGGTFTDCVVFGADGDMVLAKSASTPPGFEVGLWNALQLAAGKLETDIEGLLGSAERLAHGTTLATNALINERGARVGFITTRGFEEILWQMRGAAHCQGLAMEYWHHKVANPRPFDIVPRARVAGVSERIDRNGRVLCVLNERELVAAARRMVEEQGCQALAVGFLWSFVNPAHEVRARELIAGVFPHLPVTLSSAVAPLLGEYERFSTTVINAYLRPEVENYIGRMRAKLAAVAGAPRVFLMQASGGVAAPETVAAQAVRLLQSGPAGGVIAGLAVAESVGVKRALTADMGGTSFDVCLLDGTPPYTLRSVHNRHVVAARMIDIESIGAGGGSIARVRGGNLQVGPDSAGAWPGPACYGRGGTLPTVTDANAVLGYLNPQAILGGKMVIDRELARRAIAEQIAAPLGLAVEEAALGVIRIVNAHMADLIRFHALRRGRDPRDHLVICFGGATPLHAAGIADEVGVQGVVIPLAGTAAVLSAYGIGGARQTWFFSLGRAVPLDEGSNAALDAAFGELEAAAREQLRRDGVKARGLAWMRSASIRYRLQSNELDVRVPSGRMTAAKTLHLARRFDRIYAEAYGKDAGYREAGREVVAVHAVVLAPEGGYAMRAERGRAGDPERAALGERQCYFAQRGWTSTAVYDGDRLGPGDAVCGPAVLETEGTTVLVPPERRAVYDAHRHVFLEFGR